MGPKVEARVAYYRMADEGTAQKIADTLKKAGEGSIKLTDLERFEKRTVVRPNHYAVWFASRKGESPSPIRMAVAAPRRRPSPL